MSEKVARALGAAGEGMSCNGKPCEIRPVGIKFLTEVQRECLKQFQRLFLENYKSNLDLMELTLEDFRRKAEEVGRWDLQDLPMKIAYDPDSLVITPALTAWLEENILDGPVAEEKRLRLITAAAMDAGNLEEGVYKALTQTVPRKGRLNYVSWWVTGSIEGMVELIYASFKGQNGITKEDVYLELGNNFARMAELSRAVEKVTMPRAEADAGNAEAGTAA